MKRVLIPILMLLVFAQTFHQLIIIVEYKINKEFIASVLCINKSKPRLKCNGKCQMKKNLKENEEQQSPSGTPVKFKMDQQWFTAKIASWSIPGYSVQIMEYNAFPATHEYPSPVFTFFHPPALG